MPGGLCTPATTVASCAKATIERSGGSPGKIDMMKARVRDAEDEWSADAVVFHHLWPLWAAAAGGAGYALVWMLIGRPHVHLRGWFLPVGVVMGVVAAIAGPPARRWPRVLMGISVGWLASASATVVAAIGLRVAGNVDTLAIGALVSNLLIIAVIAGGTMLRVVIYQADRRLSDSLLAQIPSPAATRRKPRKVTVRSRDGTTHTVTVIQGGFLALRSPIRAADVVAIVTR
jgi:hypothetical protein